MSMLPCIYHIFLLLLLIFLLSPSTNAANYLSGGVDTHTMVLTYSGQAYSWGILNAITMPLPTPYTVNGKTIKKVSAGRTFQSVLTEDGKIYSIGVNEFGQFGNGAISNISSMTPVQALMTGALANEAFKDFVAGEHAITALASNNILYTFGLNDGYAGFTRQYYTIPTPINMTGALNGTTILMFGMNLHTIVLGTKGELFGFGRNVESQIGCNLPQLVVEPTRLNFTILYDKTVVYVSLGYEITMVLTSSGEVYMWGSNLSGALGDGTTVTKCSPVKVTMPANKIVTKISAGGAWTKGEYAIALTIDNQLYAWGSGISRRWYHY